MATRQEQNKLRMEYYKTQLAKPKRVITRSRPTPQAGQESTFKETESGTLEKETDRGVVTYDPKTKEVVFTPWKPGFSPKEVQRYNKNQALASFLYTENAKHNAASIETEKYNLRDKSRDLTPFEFIYNLEAGPVITQRQGGVPGNMARGEYYYLPHQAPRETVRESKDVYGETTVSRRIGRYIDVHKGTGSASSIIGFGGAMLTAGPARTVESLRDVKTWATMGGFAAAGAAGPIGTAGAIGYGLYSTARGIPQSYRNVRASSTPAIEAGAITGEYLSGGLLMSAAFSGGRALRTRGLKATAQAGAYGVTDIWGRARGRLARKTSYSRDFMRESDTVNDYLSEGYANPAKPVRSRSVIQRMDYSGEEPAVETTYATKYGTRTYRITYADYIRNLKADYELENYGKPVLKRGEGFTMDTGLRVGRSPANRINRVLPGENIYVEAGGGKLGKKSPRVYNYEKTTSSQDFIEIDSLSRMPGGSYKELGPTKTGKRSLISMFRDKSGSWGGQYAESDLLGSNGILKGKYERESEYWERFDENLANKERVETPQSIVPKSGMGFKFVPGVGISSRYGISQDQNLSYDLLRKQNIRADTAIRQDQSAAQKSTEKGILDKSLTLDTLETLKTDITGASITGAAILGSASYRGGMKMSYLGGGSGRLGLSFKNGYVLHQKQKYTPSVAGLLLGMKTPSLKGKRLTGLEIRGA